LQNKKQPADVEEASAKNVNIVSLFSHSSPDMLLR
jgi:hypothetical protein